MTPDLLTIPPEIPRWKELADLHGITTSESNPATPMDQTYWAARIEWFGANEYSVAPSEREAAIILIHRLQLTGWETVSLNP